MAGAKYWFIAGILHWGCWPGLALAQAPQAPASDDVDAYPFQDTDDVQGPFTGSEAEDDEDANTVSLSGGVGIGRDSVTLDLSLTKRLYRFFAINAQVFYQSRDGEYAGEEYQTLHYGPQFTAEIWLANPTMFTPIAGAGPGLEMWTRKYAGERYDEASSLIALYFWGVNMNLTKNFGLQVRQVTRTYTGEVPVLWTDRQSLEARDQQFTQVQFAFWF